jgi:hypothetical protein
MLEDLRDTLGLVLFVEVPATDGDTLRQGNGTSVCISYDSTARDDEGDPFRCDLGFRSVDDFRIASKRADLVFFGLNTPPFAMASYRVTELLLSMRDRV